MGRTTSRSSLDGTTCALFFFESVGKSGGGRGCGFLLSGGGIFSCTFLDAELSVLRNPAFSGGGGLDVLLELHRVEGRLGRLHGRLSEGRHVCFLYDHTPARRFVIVLLPLLDIVNDDKCYFFELAVE